MMLQRGAPLAWLQRRMGNTTLQMLIRHYWRYIQSLPVTEKVGENSREAGFDCYRRTHRFSEARGVAGIFFGDLEFLAGTKLLLRLPREHPASEEKTLGGGDEFQPRVRVTEPGTELQRQC
jgi:hypothetical protein